MKLTTQIALALLTVMAAVGNAQENGTEQEYCGCESPFQLCISPTDNVHIDTAINGLVSGRNNQKCGPLLDEAFLPYNVPHHHLCSITHSLIAGNVHRLHNPGFDR